MPQTVLITGTSSGFGKLAAKKFQAEGWNVVATMRSPDKETGLTQLDSVLVTRLDVTDIPSIDTAVAEGIERFGEIDVLVNNAGLGAHGLFEQYSADEARALYETDVFGTMNVCRAVLPHMRERRKGRIITVTSVAGLIGGPGTTLYSGCKFALEGFTESLAMDYHAWGIKVFTVAPGAFDTRFNTSANDAWDRGSDEYGQYGRKMGAYMADIIDNMKKAGGKQSDPAEVAEVIYACATEDRPIHNVVGVDAEGLAKTLATMPRQQMLEGMLARLPKLDDL